MYRIRLNSWQAQAIGYLITICIVVQPFVVLLSGQPARAESSVLAIPLDLSSHGPRISVAPTGDATASIDSRGNSSPRANSPVDPFTPTNGLDPFQRPEDNLSPHFNSKAWHHPEPNAKRETGACVYNNIGIGDSGSSTGGGGGGGGSVQPLSPCPFCAGDPIVLSNGEFNNSETDLYIPCRGLPIEISRTYRSRQEAPGIWGYNWFFNYDSRMYLDEKLNAWVVQPGTGRLEQYKWNGTNYISPDMYFDTLDPVNRNKITKKDGSYLLYDSFGRLSVMGDRFGNTLTFDYDPAGRLPLTGTSVFFKYISVGVIGYVWHMTSIKDSYGRVVSIAYYDSTAGYKAGHVKSVTDFLGRTVTYDYDTDGNLISVTSPSTTDYPTGKTTKYTYSSGLLDATGLLDPDRNHNLLTITAPNEVVNGGGPYLTNVYDGLDRVTQQTFGSGRFNYQYTSTWPSGMTKTITVRDRNNNQTDYALDAIGNRTSMMQYTAYGNFTTNYTYTSGSNLLTSVTYPLNNGIKYTYDGLGNVNSTRVKTSMTAADGPTDLITYIEHEPLFNQPKRTVDPAGNVWINYFDYEEAHALTPPAAEGFDWTYNAANAGMGDLNGDGLTSQATGAVVLRKFLGPDDGPNDTVTTNNGVRLGQPALQTIQSSYVYNNYGQVVSTTDAQGIVTHCDYFPQNDPDGGPNSVPGQTNISPTGYLKDIIRDFGTGKLNNTTAYTYDPVGNVTSVTDPRGLKTTFTINALNQVTNIDSPIITLNGGHTAIYETQLLYDYNNRVSKRRVHNINEIGAAVTTHEWIETSYTYDLLDHVLSRTDDIGPDPNNPAQMLRRTTSYQYDNNENLIQVTLPQGNVMQYFYDARDLLMKIIRDPNLNQPNPVVATTTMIRDGNSNVLSVTNPNNHASTFSYDLYGRVTAAADTQGNTATRTYDNNSNVLSVTVKNASNAVLAMSKTDYDELSRPYAGHRWISGATDATGVYLNSTILYDKNSRVTKATDSNNHSATMQYDNLGRVSLATDAFGNTVQPTYDPNSNVTKTVTTELQPGTPSSKTFTRGAAFDEIDRVVSMRDQGPDGIYNNTDDRIAAINYDSRGNPTTVVDPKGIVSQAIFDGLSRRTQTNHDAAGVNIQTQYEYDLNSRIVRYTGIRNNADAPAQFHTTYFAFDNLDRLTQTLYADGKTTSQTYDAVGNVKTATDQNGSVATFTYDTLERLTNVSIARATGVVGTTIRTYGYDGLSRVTSATDNNDPSDPGGFTECDYTYDGLSRILTEAQKYGPSGTPTVNKTVTYSFTDGQLTPDVQNLNSIAYPDGTVSRFGHDVLDRVTNVYYGNNTTNTLAAFTYAGFNRTVSHQNYTGSAAPLAIGAMSVTYDGLKRAASVYNLLQGGGQLASFDYGYDKADNRVYAKFIHKSGTGEIYRYDSSYRVNEAYYGASAGDISSAITAVTAGSDPAAPSAYAGKGVYSLDNLGNRNTVTTAGVNGASPVTTSYSSSQASTDYKMNRITSIGSVAELYDANGNQTDDGTYTYKYDAYNRIVTVTRKSDSAAIAAYKYDANGRRVRKTVTNLAASLNGTTHYTYQGAMTLEEYTVTNPGAGETLAESVRYINGRGIDERIVMERNNMAAVVGTGTNVDFQRFYYYTDGLGSVRAVTWLQPGTNSEQLIERVDYDIYGKATLTNWGADRVFGTSDDGTTSTSLVGNPFLFTGQRYDPETGNYYYRARYYSPTAGRFLSQDPAEYVDGANMYEYVGSGPLNYTDPAGLSKRSNTSAAHPAKQYAKRYGKFNSEWGDNILNADYRSMASDSDLLDLEAIALANHDNVALSSIDWEIHLRKNADEQHRQTMSQVARYRPDTPMTAGDVAGAVWSRTTKPFVNAYNHVAHPINSINADIKSFNNTVDSFLDPNNCPRALGSLLPGLSSVLHAEDVGANWNVTSNEDNLNASVDLTGHIIADGFAIGGALTSILARTGCPLNVCFTAGTLVLTPEGKEPIENIRVGDRVITKPEGEQDSSTEVDPDTWRLVRLRMPNSEAAWDIMDIEVLKLLGDISRLGWKEGEKTFVNFEEMDARGTATITSITSCPKIKSGVGRVVLKTVTHLNGTVLQLHLDGVEKLLEPTTYHKLFSATAGTWVTAGKLKIGDELTTRSGKIKVLNVQPRPGIFRVYNMEVEGDHQYFVSNGEVLSHNNDCLIRQLTSMEQMASEGEVMAGGKSGVPFRDAPRIAAEYGGDPADWVKKNSKTGLTRQFPNSPYTQQIETHWVENLKTGQRVEMKTKIVPDPPKAPATFNDHGAGI